MTRRRHGIGNVPLSLGGSGFGAAPGLGYTRYFYDTFLNTTGADVALPTHVPDVGTSWAVVTGAAATGIVSNANDNASTTSATGTYYVSAPAPPAADYRVRGLLTDNGSGLPGLLVGFSATQLDGYRVYYQSGLEILKIQRGITGTLTDLPGVQVSPGPNWGAVTHDLEFTRRVMTDRVRLTVRDRTTGQVWAYDDTGASRRVAIGRGGVALRQTSTADNFEVMSCPAATTLGRTINADGVWTWYNDNIAIYVGGATYVASLTSTGKSQITKDVSGVLTVVDIAATGLEKDDHNNGGLLALPGGRLFHAWSHHSTDTVGIRYRVSTNALPDISAWNAEVDVSNAATATAYVKPYLLSDGYVRVFYRSGATTTRPYKMIKALATDVEAGTATWAISSILQTTNERPYVKTVQNGPDRVDFFFTNGHPNEVDTSLYHCYMTVSAGVESFFKSDGTPITAGLPFDAVTEGTLIQASGGNRCWNWDISIGADGYPRCLATRYPTSTGARDVMFQDIEYWHYRWTGAAWTGFRLATNQLSLYPQENSYAGGMCFDSQDVTKLFISLIDTDATYELFEYSIDEAALTKTLVRQITANSGAHNCRPYSPKNHAGDGPRVVWWVGGYLTYLSFNPTVQAYP